VRQVGYLPEFIKTLRS